MCTLYFQRENVETYDTEILWSWPTPDTPWQEVAVNITPGWFSLKWRVIELGSLQNDLPPIQQYLFALSNISTEDGPCVSSSGKAK